MEEATKLSKEEMGIIIAALLNYLLDLEGDANRLDVLHLLDLIRNKRR